MYHHLLFEGVVEELKIAVGGVGFISYGEGVHALEKFGMQLAHCKAVRIGADVAVDGVEGAA